MNKYVFITGAAGFIGFHLSRHLLLNNWNVIGLDGFTDYYDLKLKKDRFKILNQNNKFHGFTGSILDSKILNNIYQKYKPKIIIHLAAQAGVRYSVENPMSYVENNLMGTFYILEFARKYGTDHLIMASTSSIYGNSKQTPFHENQKSSEPISFYAATKKSNEVMAHSYSHLYDIPTTVLRFFTVYGPWGRPDMALFKFTKNILSGKPIDIYNNGKMKRDFTNIYDLVEAINLLINVNPLTPFKRKLKIDGDSISNNAPYRIVNIGNSSSINLMDYIKELEKALGVEAKKNYLEIQDGDVLETFSNVDLLEALTGFRPKIPLDQGISEFVSWYKSYYTET